MENNHKKLEHRIAILSGKEQLTFAELIQGLWTALIEWWYPDSYSKSSMPILKLMQYLDRDDVCEKAQGHLYAQSVLERTFGSQGGYLMGDPIYKGSEPFIKMLHFVKGKNPPYEHNLIRTNYMIENTSKELFVFAPESTVQGYSKECEMCQQNGICTSRYKLDLKHYHPYQQYNDDRPDSLLEFLGSDTYDKMEMKNGVIFSSQRDEENISENSSSQPLVYTDLFTAGILALAKADVDSTTKGLLEEFEKQQIKDTLL